MRDYYLCYPAILTNTLVPQPGLSSLLQNQLGVTLDALTISPFLVIDDKLVEVFNGDKSMWNVKDLGIVFISGKGSPEDVHISNLLLECKCTWQVVLVEILFNLWRQFIMHEKYVKIMICIMKHGRMQTDFMWNLSSRHKVAARVADDRQY